MVGQAEERTRKLQAEVATSRQALTELSETARADAQARTQAESELGAIRRELLVAQVDAAAAREEHQRYLRDELPKELEQARAEAVPEFRVSEELRDLLANEYREGMFDFKIGLLDKNPEAKDLDWSFLPPEETTAEENVDLMFPVDFDAGAETSGQAAEAAAQPGAGEEVVDIEGDGDDQNAGADN